MDRLLKIGFRRVGAWRLSDAGIAYALDTASPHSHTLYAFLVDGEVRYVGKTTKTLRGRLNSYVKPSLSQTTNLRNNANILAALKAGSTVEIFALPDEGLHHYGVFHLNLAAGLEDSIIKMLDPNWNGGRKPSLEENVEAEETELLTALRRPEDAFHITMQPTYWRSGFFNVPMASSTSLGGDGQPIEIFRGNEIDPILGTINRTANTNGTPRVFGGTALRTWVQAHVPEMSRLKVEVLSPTSIRLSSGTEP